MKFSRLSVIFLSLYFINSYATASSLKEALHYALSQDPRVLEAKANFAIAEAQTNISKAGHFPVISLNNTQTLAQKDEFSSSGFQSRPSLRAQLNLFSWGAIQNAVERDKHKEGFFKFKASETQEQVGKSIIELYLSALKAKETIKIHQENIKRHKNLLNNIKTVARYDSGRGFEVIEAESRLLHAEATIAQQHRTLQVTLNQLNRYTKRVFTEADLQDPFINETPEKFVQQYKNGDLINNPTYQAQQKELESAKANSKVSKSKLFPAINLEGEVYKKGYNVYLGMSWNIVDLASYRAIDYGRYTEAAAQAKLDEVLLELGEQAKSAEIDMQQNKNRLAIVKKQIAAQHKTVRATELQFNVAQRSLFNVLNAYKELSDIEVEEISIKNDFRVAALNYLVSQAKVGEWAGVKTTHNQ